MREEVEEVEEAEEVEESMTGIQFVTDEKGRKVAVQIDLKKHKALWEDIADVLVSRSRRHEKGIPYEECRETRLKRRRR